MVIKGIAHWAKIVGKPSWGYQKQYKEWSIDVALNEATIKRLLDEGMDPKCIKNKRDDRGEFITFKRRELKNDGTPAKPIAIEDASGAEWDGKTLIGNGSEVLLKVVLNDIKDSKYKRPGLIKVRVQTLVPYEGKENDDEDFDTFEEESWS